MITGAWRCANRSLCALIMWLLKEAAAESKYSGWGLGGQGFEVQRMARGSLDTRLSPQHKTCRSRMNNKVLAM